ncbi:TRAP transporter small permease subunit [Epibacterium ulvae]|uniref:TRAP transporter small permease n=1 Tax=Epibacterium ulvae TaxID=1156985 RepID=UPI001BFC059A|nr:TRAP transporter small permease subunit [Epibacterium ulvae]MBT8154643.1 TRAP transporter small permease subunit [Epibacterium ulvae]
MDRDDTIRHPVQRELDRMALLFFAAGSVGILFLVGLTAVSVFWRYVLRDPIFGVQDLSSMTAAVVAACAVAYGATQNSHITVNIMPKHFGRRARRITDIVARGGGAVILTLAASALIKKGGCGLACGNITSNLNILHTPFYYVLAFALGFFALYLVALLVIGLSHWNGEDPNEAIE